VRREYVCCGRVWAFSVRGSSRGWEVSSRYQGNCLSSSPPIESRTPYAAASVFAPPRLSAVDARHARRVTYPQFASSAPPPAACRAHSQPGCRLKLLGECQSIHEPFVALDSFRRTFGQLHWRLRVKQHDMGRKRVSGAPLVTIEDLADGLRMPAHLRDAHGPHGSLLENQGRGAVDLHAAGRNLLSSASRSRPMNASMRDAGTSPRSVA